MGRFYARMIWLCFFGPRLKRIIYKGATEMEERPYAANAVERRSDKLISMAALDRAVFKESFDTKFKDFVEGLVVVLLSSIKGQSILLLIYHTLPFILFYYAVKEVVGTPRFMNLIAALKEYTSIPVIFTSLFILRGLGRMANKEYRKFLVWLINAQHTKESFTHHNAMQSAITSYDFEMSHYPVSFSQSDATIKPRALCKTSKSSLLDKVWKFPLYALSYFVAHMFARRLIYPGSLAVTQAIMAPYIENGRAKLVTQRGGIRAKLLAADGNHIDVIFLDRRIKSLGKYHFGNKLVICCESNASFYEIGMIEVPIGGGYSVLGWNHPGFAESTGLPFPSQESNAIDVVIKYAVCELEFSFEDIIIYGWSIGGYTASWAAMSYPKISAVVLDATFDHILPLAQSRMPSSFAYIVEMVIMNYMNLNISEQLCYYPGPVFLVRRQLDELIATNPLDLKTNRINVLLYHLLQNRYPYLVSTNTIEVLQNWIDAKNSAVRDAIERSIAVNKSHCYTVLNDYMTLNGCDYPWSIGRDLCEKERCQLLLYLAGQYFTSCEIKHNDPLPLNKFRIPLSGNLQFLQLEA